jgi:hypothetical protein
MMNDFVKKYMRDWYFRDQKLMANTIIINFQKDYQIELKKSTVHRLMAQIKAEEYAGEDECFGLLRSWAEKFKMENPGTFIEIKTNQSNSGEETFYGIFVAVGIVIQSHKYNKPVVGLDSAHLKGRYKGNDFQAVTKDAENKLQTLAFAIVADNESKESWGWFLRCFSDAFKFNNEDVPKFFVSDRDKGLGPAFSEVLPDAVNMFCTEHIKSIYFS